MSANAGNQVVPRSLIALSRKAAQGVFYFREGTMGQYIFSPTACEAGLEEELAAALEKRTEVIARASFPNMWKKRML